MRFLLIPLLLPLLSVDGRRRCVRAVGQLRCPTDWDRHYNVKVVLLDKDDDVMGSTTTDEDGNYVVEGCGDDLGHWNDPDPYILVEHRCPEPGHTISIPRRYHQIMVERRFLPDVIYVETVRIDELSIFRK